MPRNIPINLTGKHYGLLTVLRPAEEKGKWRVKCQCGNEKIVKGASLRSGNTKSCGCLTKRNPGRPQQKAITPHISTQAFLEDILVHIAPMREFLKANGVFVKGNMEQGTFTINGHPYGPYQNVLQALFAAMQATVIGLEPVKKRIPNKLDPTTLDSWVKP